MATDKDFKLDGLPSQPLFELELCAATTSLQSPLVQVELHFPEVNAETPKQRAQYELAGMEKPAHAVTVLVENSDMILRTAQFQHANTLLDSLESYNIDVPYQCREGYCGGCRTQILSGTVVYLQEPMAWINDDEILPCCCVPKTDLVVKLKG